MQITSKPVGPSIHPFDVPRKFPSFETKSREMPANLVRPSYAQKHRTCKACDLERAKAVDVHSHAIFRLANPSAIEQLVPASIPVDSIEDRPVRGDAVTKSSGRSVGHAVHADSFPKTSSARHLRREIPVWHPRRVLYATGRWSGSKWWRR